MSYTPDKNTKLRGDARLVASPPLSDDDTSIATTEWVRDVAAPLESPAFTGTPTVPTAAEGTNTLQAASTAFVQSAVSGTSAQTIADLKKWAFTIG